MTTTANDDKRQRGMDLPPGKIAYNVDEAGSAIGLSRATVFDMIREGEVIAKKVRGRTVIPREELQRLIDEAPPARAA